MPTRALALALLATAASAQPAERPVPSTRQTVWLVTGGATAGLVTGVAFFPAAPIAVAAATYGASAALGLHPTVGGVVLDAAAGTLVAVATTAGTFTLAVEAFGAPGDLGTAIGSLAVGVMVGGASAGLAHSVRLRLLRSGAAVTVTPAALAAPTGEGGAGLRVTVGL